MLKIELSSGDLTADRRAEYARLLSESGDDLAAADLMEQALELVPLWVAGWFQLGEYRAAAGLCEKAAEAWRRTLDLDPQDMFAAGLKLALIGAEEAPEHPPSRYVEALFDDYADRFETSLVDKLDYRAPQDLMAMLLSYLGMDKRFATSVDLGCGTGLMGVELRAHTDRLEGFDLSSAMLIKAREKAIYDALDEADLSLDRENCGLFGKAGDEGRADLAVAADVLMYLGALNGVFALVSALLAPGGYFAFSVERPEDGDIALAPSLRYQHSEPYVLEELNKAGLCCLTRQDTVLRKDGGNPVFGILFLARKIA
ncbi:methyltransferase [Allorhizobium sp. BGMRC 0089]|uniref:methyltransferase domain-containing protein n=1 Tax=Allorhizobium sonneratiae TaxID=2934936 RepID=UPI002033F16D|nr:methyltransferase domain-containing protein [Allorhizobium sonneratiae]MCM2291467.1 methyltransferase [Allorhizobium sonneratiae]